MANLREAMEDTSNFQIAPFSNKNAKSMFPQACGFFILNSETKIINYQYVNSFCATKDKSHRSMFV